MFSSVFGLFHLAIVPPSSSLFSQMAGFPYDPAVSLLAIYLKELKSGS